MCEPVYHSEQVARRRYQCHLCYESIRRGARYQRSVWSEDGALAVTRTHSACAAWLHHMARHAEHADDIYESTDSVLWMRLQEDCHGVVGGPDERGLWLAILRELDDDALDEWADVVAGRTHQPHLWTGLFLGRTRRSWSAVAGAAIVFLDLVSGWPL